ncbi:DUF1997 domain-containing protein [Aerosakkonemataceae cyanobacterium BLCC-F154]|uniref:DUF1997 domain-containing protein n=1 Tax=Floridaenema fluviatile BLCC-F154 TaxID=3153640 RepID=A0ABV4YFF0_9CYAN
MQSQYSEYQSIELSETLLDFRQNFSEAEEQNLQAAEELEPFRFHGYFEDCMEMSAPPQVVAEYLNAHHEWFRRCAQPMKAEPLGENGYALVIGKFGSFGYEVEPKIGLHLLPPEAGIYRIRTISIPGYVTPGYDVDFNAAMKLIEVNADLVEGNTQTNADSPSTITRIEWQLDLAVFIKFPRFIYRLPKSLIQTTGDRLLAQIVRQVNRRLTQKVQEDFHSSLGLPLPQKSKRQ